MTGPPILTGERVGLRPWRLEDAPALLGACEDREISDWSSFPFHPSTESVAAWVQRQISARRCALAVVRPTEDIALGWCGLSGLERGPEHGSLGYWLVREARGDGLMAPAAQLLCDWAFATGTATRITMLIKPANTPSLRVAARLGATAIVGEELDTDRRGRAHRFRRFELYAPT